jgi:hypothetical protein
MQQAPRAEFSGRREAGPMSRLLIRPPMTGRARPGAKTGPDPSRLRSMKMNCLAAATDRKK